MDWTKNTYNQVVHDFRNSKKEGDKGEVLFQYYLKKAKISYKTTVGKSPYDFELFNGKTIDVKYDQMMSKTGNLALEIKSSNSKDGWMLSPKADFYVYIDSQEETHAFLFSSAELTSILEHYLRSNPLEFVSRLRTVNNGTYASIVWIVDKKKFLHKRVTLEETVKILGERQ